MKRSKFDEFVNFYDRETQGRYAYYYRQLWDACSHADVAYAKDHKQGVWESKGYEEWIRSFDRFIKENMKEDKVKESVSESIKKWVEML